MPKRVSRTELDELKRIIDQYPDGARIDELLKAKQLSLSRRTLQRRLNRLVEEGQIAISGQGAGYRYHHLIAPLSSPYGHFQIPLSSKSQWIRKTVNQPLAQRVPSHYNIQLLNAYLPNKTHYLSVATLKHLKNLGTHSTLEQIAGTYAKKILNYLLIDLSWNSSRLEGNTYSLLETERLLEFGEVPQNKSAAETQMLLNHKAAIEFLVDAADNIAFNYATILNLHALLSDNLLSNPAACGRLRNIPVAIAKTTYAPLNIPQLIEEYFNKILGMVCQIQDPFEQAFFVMVHLPYLQPFEDVNKRVSRLSANIPLIQNNLSPLSFVDVPEKAYIDALLGVYELNRLELLKDIFVWAYERSALRYTTARQVLGEPDPFRLHYRQQLIEILSAIVGRCLNVNDSIHYMQAWIESHIPARDKARFREITETELLNLHPGNIARFRIKTPDFEKWHQQYKKR